MSRRHKDSVTPAEHGCGPRSRGSQWAARGLSRGRTAFNTDPSPVAIRARRAAPRSAALWLPWHSWPAAWGRDGAPRRRSPASSGSDCRAGAQVTSPVKCGAATRGESRPEPARGVFLAPSKVGYGVKILCNSSRAGVTFRSPPLPRRPQGRGDSGRPGERAGAGWRPEAPPWWGLPCLRPAVPGARGRPGGDRWAGRGPGPGTCPR